MRSYSSLLPRIPIYNVFRRYGKPRIFPMNYTLSITNVCPSRCKTCFIWKVYREKPHLKNDELSTSEWERTVHSLGKSPFWVTMSGGEPFARRDFVQICRAVCEVNEPRIINIPTNGLLYDQMKSDLPKIVDSCATSNVSLVVNLSIDGISEEHDDIRGVEGNWDKAMRSLSLLKEMKKENHNLVVGVHTVVSNYNILRLQEIIRYVIEKLKPDHYILEVAEERSELFNKKTGITPTPSHLRQALQDAAHYLRSNSPPFKGLENVSQAFRFRYYELLPKILEEKRQQVPCMSSVASCQITPIGDVWACCILGYEKPLGNLREVGFSFDRIWRGNEVENVRKFIREGKCACPLANAHYTSLLLDLTEVSKVMLKML